MKKKIEEFCRIRIRDINTELEKSKVQSWYNLSNKELHETRLNGQKDSYASVLLKIHELEREYEQA